MSTSLGRLAVLCLALVFVPCASARQAPEANESNGEESKKTNEVRLEEGALNIYYLEIVTPSVQETCNALEKAHGVTFDKTVVEFGNARTARLKSGGRIGVRAPMRDTEEPVVRPYLLVEDIHAAVQAVEDAGAEVALPPTEIPGQGTFAIYLLGGIQHGLWQN